ncbi:hypothetical protein AT959_17085 [Dechloromonas denitrificans]|uniref:Uncharacterized protein n=1 Tax=Dechloromonas denitrificans TaxID=281362 RepID=A0A133XFH0_9RHOO|nr:hypothetical protein [Dechloromonas denitrificans]KXB29646.1 hypothetical protein AT959_17085 [Dechloromonas denitrificans]
MNFRLAALAICLAFPLSLRADAGVSPDIERFVDIADTCLHLAGEWDSSLPKAQQREIERKANSYCMRAKKQYRALLIKYKDSPEIVRRLNDYEDLNSVSD